MKRAWIVVVFVVCVAVLLAAPCASYAASDVTLAWDANTETDLAGYKIYYGTAPRPADATRESNPYPNVIDVQNVTTYTVANLANGAWCFAATAYNTGGAESEFSNEVCTNLNVPPAAPKTMRITTIVTVDVNVSQP